MPESVRRSCGAQGVVQFLPGIVTEREAEGYESHAFAGWEPDKVLAGHAQRVVGEVFAPSSSQKARAHLAEAPEVLLHSAEVAMLAVMALAHAGASLELQLIAAQISLWHDVGKEDPTVKAAITGAHQLSADQRRVMERHTVKSASRAQEALVHHFVVLGALMHHSFIRHDPTTARRPYPDVGNTDEVPEALMRLVAEHWPANEVLQFVVAIVAIADHFSAVSTAGPGRLYHGAIADPRHKLRLVADDLDVPPQALRTMHDTMGVPQAA